MASASNPIAFDPETRFILRNFPLQMDEHIEIKSLCSLFRAASFHTPFTDRPKSYADVMPRARFRLNLLQVHENLYFEHQAPKDRNALVAAVLLGDFAESSAGRPSNNPFAGLRAIRRSLPEDAINIRANVNDFIEMGLNWTDADIQTRETTFAAHFEALEKIHEAKTIDKTNKGALEQMALEYFGIYKEFADKDSYIGQHLLQQMREVLDSLDFSPPPRPKRRFDPVVIPGGRM